MQSERFQWTLAVLEQGIAEGLIPGGVVSAFRLEQDGEVHVTWAGQRRITPTPQPMLLDSIFDWASVSKALGTSALVWLAFQRGWIGEETSIASVLPEAPAQWRQIRIGHLLSHSAGFRAWGPVWQGLQKKWGTELAAVSIRERQREFRSRIWKEPPEVAAGKRVLYSDFSFLLLGFILEEIHGIPLDEIWKREMPGMGAVYRRVERAGAIKQPADERCVATEEQEWRGGVIQGEVHDENCWSMGGYAGHAGLFGSMLDLIEATRRIFDSRFLDPALRARMMSRVIGPEGPIRTLGWDVATGPESSAGPTLASRRGVVGHLGFTGTSLWVDQKSGWAVSVLTGRVHLGREHLGIRKFRPRIHDALAIDLGLDVGIDA